MGSAGSEGDRFAAAWALREAVPTRRHAEMLFEMAREAFGESAWVESLNGGTLRKLHRREGPGSRFVVPWPVLTVGRGGREGPSPLPTGVPGVFEEPKRRPGPAPKLRDLGPGMLTVHDGPHSRTVAYGRDGRWFETSQSRHEGAFADLPAALDRPGAAVELVADFAAALDPGRHGPARAHLPVALPRGPSGVWNCALHAIREALFHGRQLPAGDLAAADGWTGRAFARSGDREALLAAFRAEVERSRPFPERPPPAPDDLPEPFVEQEETEDGFRIRGVLRGPSSDTPPVEPTVANTPAGLTTLPETPSEPSPLGAWTFLASAHGVVRPSAIRWEPEGFTLIGPDLLDRIDPKNLEEALAAADRDASPWPEWNPPPGIDTPAPDTYTRIYEIRDEGGDPAAGLRVAGGQVTPGIIARSLDADRLRAAVVRTRSAPF